MHISDHLNDVLLSAGLSVSVTAKLRALCSGCSAAVRTRRRSEQLPAPEDESSVKTWRLINDETFVFPPLARPTMLIFPSDRSSWRLKRDAGYWQEAPAGFRRGVWSELCLFFHPSEADFRRF